MNAIEVTDAHIALVGNVVLRGVNLSIAQNQFIALLGPNGAGKTTLLRAILGLVKPYQGAITVLGKPAGQINTEIGYVPQTRSVLAHANMRGIDFVASAIRGAQWGWPSLSASQRHEVDWALDRVQASGLALRAIHEMSGGERQRLLLAQALLGRPQLLLLDEPLISLDLQHQNNIIALVREIQQDLQITVLFSAHEINPLLGVVDQVLYLGNQQAALGTVNEVITESVLSRLYATPIEVLHQRGRVFVMAGRTEIVKPDHCHDA